MKSKIKKFVCSLLERKVVFAILSILEKYFIIANCIDLPTNMLIFIIAKDLYILILFSIISFDKISVKVRVDK